MSEAGPMLHGSIQTLTNLSHRKGTISVTFHPSNLISIVINMLVRGLACIAAFGIVLR